MPIPKSPLEVLELYFTPDSGRDSGTDNSYAEETIGADAYASWKASTCEDIRAFMGFNILMGINCQPSTEDYWKKDPIHYYKPIAQRISRDRFWDISRYLHFVDNSTLSLRGSANYDKLGKVRPLIKHFQERFSSLYNPNCEIAIDEAMIKVQGHSSLKEYMPMKPIKRGTKVWVRADSRNGYFSQFEVYTGKKKGAIEHQLGARVVKDLTKELQGKWHRVYFDNFLRHLAYSVIWKRVGSMGVGQPERIDVVFQRTSRRQNLRTGKIHTLHKQKLDTNNLWFTPCMPYHITSTGYIIIIIINV